MSGTMREALFKAGLIKEAVTEEAETNELPWPWDRLAEFLRTRRSNLTAEPEQPQEPPPLNFLGIKSDREMANLHPSDPAHLAAGGFYRRTRDTHGGKARLDREKHGKKRFKPRKGGGSVRKW
jgi:hypothetical protein